MSFPALDRQEQCSKLKEKMTEMNKHQAVTMYKNNSRDSSKFKGCSPLQLSCNLIGKVQRSRLLFLYSPLYGI